MSVVQVGTIREIQARLVDEGYHVTTYAIRRWVKTGKLPAVYSGTRTLISYQHVLSLLNCSTPTTA